MTGVGIVDDILYGPRQVQRLVQAALRVGVRATYREIASTKGHDAFLVEWGQLANILDEASRPGGQRAPIRRRAPSRAR